MAEDKQDRTTNGNYKPFDESKHPRDKEGKLTDKGADSSHLVRATYISQGKELPKDSTAYIRNLSIATNMACINLKRAPRPNT